MNTYSRRNLIGASVTALSVVRSTAANSAITVGVLGTGDRGTYVSTMMAKNTPARIVALCDLFPEKMEKAKQSIGVDNPKLYKDFREMLASNVDAVIIATPVFLHAEHLEAAIKAGKAYLYRKARVRRRGRLQTHHASRRLRGSEDQHHFRISASLCAGLSESETTGGFRRDRADPSGLRALHQERKRVERQRRSCLTPKTEMEKIVGWHGWKDLSGDLIVENNVHSIDVLNWFLGGRPESAIGSGGATQQSRGDMRDHNFVAYEYRNGIQGQLSGTTLASPGYRDVVEQFFGEKGMIETSENHWRHFRGPAAGDD